MSEFKQVLTPLNSESQDFIISLTSGLISMCQREWNINQRLIQRLENKDLDKFPNSKELRDNLEKYHKIVAEMEERGNIMQKFPSIVAQLMIEQIEMPIPEFLARELIHMGKEAGDYDYSALRATKESKAGYISQKLKGGEIVFKINFGDSEGNPSAMATSFSLLPTSLLRQI